MHDKATEILTDMTIALVENSGPKPVSKICRNQSDKTRLYSELIVAWRDGNGLTLFGYGSLFKEWLMSDCNLSEEDANECLRQAHTTRTELWISAEKFVRSHCDPLAWTTVSQFKPSLE